MFRWLCQVFPFSVVFDEQLTIIYVGRTLQKLFDAEANSRRSSSATHSADTGHSSSRQNVQLIGRPLGEHFSLIRPQMTDLTWQNVRTPTLRSSHRRNCVLACVVRL